MGWIVVIVGGIMLLLFILLNGRGSKSNDSRPQAPTEEDKLFRAMREKGERERGALNRTRLVDKDEELAERIKKLILNVIVGDFKKGSPEFEKMAGEMKVIAKGIAADGGEQRWLKIKERIKRLSGMSYIGFSEYVYLIEDSFKEKTETLGNNNSTQVGGAFYWFDWQQISDSGERMYGAYVYKNVIRFLSPQHLGHEMARGLIMDGDFLSTTQLNPDIPATDPTMLKINEQGIDTLYILSVKGDNIDYAKLDADLKKATTGYIGMVMTRPMDDAEFYKIGQAMVLIPSIGIAGHVLEKIDFGMLGDATLKEMGFDVRQMAP